jgi:hypothetical protein
MKEELRSESRSLRSLQDGNENRGQLFAFLSQPLPLSSLLLGFGVCIRLLLSAFH